MYGRVAREEEGVVDERGHERTQDGGDYACP